jgi:trehalose/maltose hydrolase-like predicted phosphorylase
MLFFLFSPTELGDLFARLGYEYSDDLARRTIDYYDRRTSHGSTLSLVTHAGALARFDPEGSWERFIAALGSDIDDTQDGTTTEGIHLGVMAGTLDVVQRAYLGIEIRDDVSYFNPTVADRLDGLRLSIHVRRTRVIVSLDGSEITVAVPADGNTGPINVGVGVAARELCAGQSVTFKLW